MIPRSLFGVPVALFSVFATSSLAQGQGQGQDLVSVLLANGLTEIARKIQDSNSFDPDADLLIFYAPTNAALESSNITDRSLQRRDVDDDDLIYLSVSNVDSTSSRSGGARSTTTTTTTTNAENRARDLASSSSYSPSPSPLPSPPNSAGKGNVYVTLLNDPRLVNLGPGRNQTIVEKEVASGGSLPVVFTGSGSSVRVTGEDIPYDKGIIRPIGGLLSIPGPMSETLPFLNVNKFHALLEKSGLKEELDSTPAITLLAPDDSAIPDDAVEKWSDAQIADLLRQHVLVGITAYSPQLEDGDVFTTLAGTEVTVHVRDEVIYVDGARLLVGDALTRNGVAHVIENVLSPPPQVPTGAAAAVGMFSLKVMVGTFVSVAAAARYFGFM